MTKTDTRHWNKQVISLASKHRKKREKKKARKLNKRRD